MSTMPFPRYFDKYVTSVKIVQKSKSWFMRLLASCLWVLNQLKVTAIKDFMGGYITTIGNTIYGSGNWSMSMTTTTTLMHELTHVCEGKLDPLYSVKYLFSANRRAFYESVCIQTEMLYDRDLRSANYATKRARFLVAYGVPFKTALEECIKRLDEVKTGRPQLAASMVFDAYNAWK